LSRSLLIMFDTLLLRPSLHCNTPLHFTTLHPTTLHHTSPNYTSPHFTTLHPTTLHHPSPKYTSPHFTTLHSTTLTHTHTHTLTHTHTHTHTHTYTYTYIYMYMVYHKTSRHSYRCTSPLAPRPSPLAPWHLICSGQIQFTSNAYSRRNFFADSVWTFRDEWEGIDPRTLDKNEAERGGVQIVRSERERQTDRQRHLTLQAYRTCSGNWTVSLSLSL